MNERWEGLYSNDEMILTGDNQSTRSQTCRSATLPIINPT